MDRRGFLLTSMACLGLRPLLAQAASADLQLKLHQEQVRARRPHFVVAFLNGGNAALTLDIGVVLGDGAYANGIQFLLTDSRNRMRVLVKRKPGLIAGKAAPYIIKLPAGEAFRLESIDLLDYWSYEPNLAELHLPAGVYSLAATFQGGDPNKSFVPSPAEPHTHAWPQQFWTGRATSNTIKFQLTSRV